MSLIDAHVHLYPDELNRAPAEWAEARGEAHWGRLCTRRRKNGRAVQGFPDVDGVLRAMDEGGVGRAVLLGWYWEKPDSCTWQNRFYAECVRAHPDRLSACATLHPGAGSVVVREEIRRAADAGFVGLGELSPHSQGVGIDDPVWREVLTLAGELRLPVNLHVTEPGGRAYPGKVATPLGDFVRLAREHPATTFVLAHWGARLPLDPVWGEEAKRLGNLFYDTAASPLIYAEGGVVAEMVAAVGAERVMLGSDFPLVLFPEREVEPAIGLWVEEVRASGLRAEDLEAVLGGTARRVFRL